MRLAQAFLLVAVVAGITVSVAVVELGHLEDLSLTGCQSAGMPGT